MKKFYPYILLLLVSLPALLPLFHPGFFPTDDGNWMVIRFSAFFDALRHGQFPVRFLSRLNGEYGYPVADFLYPLFMYIGVPIHILGIGFVNTIKVIFGLSLISSSFFTFLWLKKSFSTKAAFLGASCYLYFPYHLFDVYQRGSIGEVLALAIVPLILWQMERKSILWSSISIALLILSHNTLAFIFLPVLILYAFVKRFPVRFIIIIFTYGIALTAFFWWPALYDKQITVFDSIKVSNFASYFITTKNITLIGIVLLIALLQCTYLYFEKPNNSLVYFLFLSVVVLFFILPLSSIFWSVSPITKLIQFPWRLVSILVLTTSFFLAYIVDNVKKYHLFLFVFYAIIIIFSAGPYLLVANYQYYPDSFYSTNEDTTTVQNEYMPKWVTTLPQDTQKAIILDGKGSIRVVSFSPNKTVVVGDFLTRGLVQFHLIYFPGWKVFVDNKEVGINFKKNGLIIVDVPQGSHTVIAQFSQTNLDIVSGSISLIALISLCLLTRKLKYV